MSSGKIAAAGIAGLALVVLARQRSKKKPPPTKGLKGFVAPGSGPTSSSVPQGQSETPGRAVFQWAGTPDGIAYTPVETGNDIPFELIVLLPEKGDFLTLIPENLRATIKPEEVERSPASPRAMRLTQVRRLQPGSKAVVTVREIGGPMHTFALEP